MNKFIRHIMHTHANKVYLVKRGRPFSREVQHYCDDQFEQSKKSVGTHVADAVEIIRKNSETVTTLNVKRTLEDIRCVVQHSFLGVKSAHYVN